MPTARIPAPQPITSLEDWRRASPQKAGARSVSFLTAALIPQASSPTPTPTANTAKIRARVVPWFSSLSPRRGRHAGRSNRADGPLAPLDNYNAASNPGRAGSRGIEGPREAIRTCGPSSVPNVPESCDAPPGRILRNALAARFLPDGRFPAGPGSGRIGRFTAKAQRHNERRRETDCLPSPSFVSLCRCGEQSLATSRNRLS